MSKEEFLDHVKQGCTAEEFKAILTDTLGGAAHTGADRDEVATLRSQITILREQLLNMKQALANTLGSKLEMQQIYRQLVTHLQSESPVSGGRLFSDEDIKKFFSTCPFAEKGLVEQAMKPMQFD